MNYGRTLQRLRKLKGVSQLEVAEHINVSRTTYVNLEKGMGELTLSKIITLAEYYKVSINYFINIILNTDNYTDCLPTKNQEFCDIKNMLEEILLKIHDLNEVNK